MLCVCLCCFATEGEKTEVHAGQDLNKFPKQANYECYGARRSNHISPPYEGQQQGDVSSVLESQEWAAREYHGGGIRLFLNLMEVLVRMANDHQPWNHTHGDTPSGGLCQTEISLMRVMWSSSAGSKGWAVTEMSGYLPVAAPSRRATARMMLLQIVIYGHESRGTWNQEWFRVPQVSIFASVFYSLCINSATAAHGIIIILSWVILIHMWHRSMNVVFSTNCNVTWMQWSHGVTTGI